jgi:hypothetical protein
MIAEKLLSCNVHIGQEVIITPPKAYPSEEGGKGLSAAGAADFLLGDLCVNCAFVNFEIE